MSYQKTCIKLAYLFDSKSIKKHNSYLHVVNTGAIAADNVRYTRRNERLVHLSQF